MGSLPVTIEGERAYQAKMHFVTHMNRRQIRSPIPTYIQKGIFNQKTYCIDSLVRILSGYVV